MTSSATAPRCPTAPRRPIDSLAEAEAYVASICFKHGPPEWIGAELEWTVHHRGRGDQPLDGTTLARALGPYAPATLAASPASSPRTSSHTLPDAPLAGGSRITVEPGGQVELSSRPFTSVAALVAALDTDITALDSLLAAAGLCRGEQGVDPHRHQPRLLEVPRYAAMQAYFDRIGPWGAAMMCRTASTQVCLDAGETRDVATRWHALHAMGPALVALFANSPVVAGRDTGWASNRLRATLGTCPPVTGPPEPTADPAEAWVQRAMTAPVICVRRDGECWDPPAAMTFADWVAGRQPPRPTYDDLDYHLTTLFPPVRPRGYVEVRYLDAQPTHRWHHPVVLLAALTSGADVVDAAIDRTERTGHLWLTAARDGLRSPALRTAARALVDLAGAHLGRLDLDPDAGERLLTTLHRRLDGQAEEPAPTAPHLAPRGLPA